MSPGHAPPIARQMGEMFPHGGFASVVMATAVLATAAGPPGPPSPEPMITAAPSSPPSSTPPAILYPTGTPTVNHVDTVQVMFESPWDNPSVELLCEIDAASNAWAVAELDFNQSAGTLAIAPIQAGLAIPQFPVPCHLLLSDASNTDNAVTGGSFTMTSTHGVASVYGLDATVAGGPAPTSLADPSRTDPSTTPTAPSSSNTGTDTASGARGPSPTSTASLLASVPSHGLSGGAKAGIAIGVILAILALFAVFFVFYIRPRRTRHAAGVPLGSTASAERIVPAEKALPPIPAAPPTPVAPPIPATSASPRVVQIGGNSHRNSEDWRRFFRNGTSSVAGTDPLSE